MNTTITIVTDPATFVSSGRPGDGPQASGFTWLKVRDANGMEFFNALVRDVELPRELGAAIQRFEAFGRVCRELA